MRRDATLHVPIVARHDDAGSSNGVSSNQSPFAFVSNPNTALLIPQQEAFGSGRPCHHVVSRPVHVKAIEESGRCDLASDWKELADSLSSAQQSTSIPALLQPDAR